MVEVGVGGGDFSGEVLVTVREALQRLETQSMLTRDGRSLIVATLDHNQLAELYTVRTELEALAEEGAQFDLVICDPPAFAPSKQALEAGLRAYERVARLAAPLVAPGGYLGLCSCSHAADLAAFRNASARGIGRGGRRMQLIHTGQAGPDHPTLPQLAETGYLKALFFRLDG